MNVFSLGNYWIQFHVSMTLQNTLTRFFPVVPKLFCKFKYPQICDVNNVSNRGCIQEIAIVILILFDIWALIRQCFQKWQKMILNDLSVYWIYISIFPWHFTKLCSSLDILLHHISYISQFRNFGNTSIDSCLSTNCIQTIIEWYHLLPW